jgi:hypothetical protein
MNERIKELAEQAGFNPYNYQGSNSALFEKFAELIIQECISKLDEEIYRAIDGDGEEIWVDLILNEHFGVEE